MHLHATLRGGTFGLSFRVCKSNFPDLGVSFGDFNTIIGAHEYKSSSSTARIPIEDFQCWTESNNLIHLPTKGTFFSWANGRRGSAYKKRRLNRAIVNQNWIDHCSFVSCSTLTKTKSNHFPLLLDFSFSNPSFKSQFKFLRMWSLHMKIVKRSLKWSEL